MLSISHWRAPSIKSKLALKVPCGFWTWCIWFLSIIYQNRILTACIMGGSFRDFLISLTIPSVPPSLSGFVVHLSTFLSIMSFNWSQNPGEWICFPIVLWMEKLGLQRLNNFSWCHSIILGWKHKSRSSYPMFSILFNLAVSPNLIPNMLLGRRNLLNCNNAAIHLQGS